MFTICPFNWPSDLVCDQIWPIFELDLDIIKTNILTRMPLIPPQRDKAARLRERLAFARCRYNLVIGTLVAEEERHGIIHFTAHSPSLVGPALSLSFSPPIFSRASVTVTLTLTWWKLRWAGFYNLRATLEGQTDAGLSLVELSARIPAGLWAASG